MAQSQYDFPILKQDEIISEFNEIVPPSSAITIADLRKPTPSKWQQIYIDVLCFVFDVRAEQLTMLTFEENSALPFPELQNDFMVYLRLSKVMSWFLYTCRYTDFKLADITTPNPQRLEKILSAIINFCRHREDTVSMSSDIVNREKKARSQSEGLRQQIDETKSWINDRLKIREENVHLVRSKKAEIEDKRKAIDDLKASQAELDTKIRHLKLEASELQKSNDDLKLRKATLKEEVENLNRDIVPSPEKLQQEIQEQKNKLVGNQQEIAQVQGVIEETGQRGAEVKETNEALVKVLQTLKSTEDEAARCEELKPKLKELQDVLAARKEEYGTLGGKLQQLDRLEASKVEKMTKLELAHATRIKHCGVEDLRHEKELLSKNLNGANSVADDARAALFQLREKIELEERCHREKMDAERRGYEKVIDSMKRYQERQLRKLPPLD